MMRRSPIVFTALVLLSFSVVEVQAEFGDYRSIFVDRFDFPYTGSIPSMTNTINQMMQEAADEGFSEVIWQVRGRGDALYNSNFEPDVHNLTPGFDPLQTAIDAAHSRGLKLHAWFNSTPMWNTTAINPPSGHIYNNTSPSFRLEDINGNLEPQEGYPLSSGGKLSYSSVNPILPEVHTHLNNVVNDVATNYDVDGIHLDYIRYIPAGYDFDRFPHDATSHSLFAQAYPGLDGSNPANFTEYKEFITTRITDLVGSIKQTVDAAEISEGRTMEFSASVWRDPDIGLNDYMQDYRTWMENDLLDVVMPMIYLSASNDHLFNPNLQNTMSIPTNTRVVPTLASYLHVQPGGGGANLTLSQIQRANSFGADGVNFYDFPAYMNSYSNADRQAIKSYFDSLQDPPPGSPGDVIDDFETDEGHFPWSLTYSGSTTGILGGSDASRVTTESQGGVGSQEISINGEPGGWFLRHLSGIGSPASPAGNVAVDATGYIGFWLKTDDAGISVQLAIDDLSPAIDRSFSQSVIADGEWHLYQWDLEDDTQWDGWAGGGDGVITGPTITIDSIQFAGAGDATIYLDTVSHNPLGLLGSAIAGDFDGDGDVDDADLAQWEGDYGVNSDSDADEDGMTTGLDFLYWQENYTGSVSPLAAAAVVPEPSAIVLASVLLGLMKTRRRMA